MNERDLPIALPPGLDMRQKQQRHGESDVDMKAARPRLRNFRGEVIEPEGSCKEHRITREHNSSGGAVFHGPPGAATTEREEGAEDRKKVAEFFDDSCAKASATACSTCHRASLARPLSLSLSILRRIPGPSDRTARQ